MIPISVTISALLLLALTATGTESDTRAVTAEFNRCESATERIKREMSRFEETVQTIKRISVNMHDKDKSGDLSREVANLESKNEYFLSRINRIANQRDKIQDDLKSVKGPTCPSCLSSSVNLFCRSSDLLATEIEQYLSRASDLAEKLHDRSNSQSPAIEEHRNDSSLVIRRKSIGAQMTFNRTLMDSCTVAAGQSLWKQCMVNLHRADSLLSTGAIEQSDRTLGVVELLLGKAIRKCGGE
jgi:FtsZ-binding cell division protein ZapB